MASDDDDDPFEHILGALIAERRRQGLTQEQLSEQLGFARNYVSMYESGKIRPKFHTLLPWAAALGFELQAVLRRVPDGR